MALKAWSPGKGSRAQLTLVLVGRVAMICYKVLVQLVSVWELLATDGAAGVISVILPFVSLLIDRPRVLRFSLPVTAVLRRRGRLTEHVELHRFPRPQ
jgi:hypothetical protein